jgi:hypothetical protein
MKVALIPPNVIRLDYAQRKFHLIVPDSYSEEVANYNGYVILDNGAAEKNLKGLNWLDRACDTGLFNEVVSIDKLGDCEFSIEGAKSMELISNKYPDMSIMGVVQGDSMAKVVKCLTAYQHMEHIDVIGLPRVLNEQFGPQSRLRLAEAIQNDPDFNKPIHCLGAWYGFSEEIKYLSDIESVRSMDSSLPFVLGLQNLSFMDRLPSDLKRPSMYFSSFPTATQRKVIDDNVRIYLNWAQTS